MKCPSCSSPLREVRQHGIRLDVCACGGIWFDVGELEAWYANLRPGAARPQLPGHFLLHDDDGRPCPHCTDAVLRRFDVGEVRGSLCRQCRGVWLTAIDAQRVRRQPVDAASGPTTGALAYGISDGLMELLLGVAIGL